MLSAWENTLLLFLCKANGGFALWMAQALLQCRALLSRLAWAIHHSESMNMNAGGGSHGGELREPEGGLASHEACSRQPSCSLIRAPSITLALYSICGSWFSYYGELPFPNFKAHVFIKASEIIFTLQLWFLPIVFYHPGNKAELSWAPYSELSNVSYSTPLGGQKNAWPWCLLPPHCQSLCRAGSPHWERRRLLYLAMAQFLFSSVRWTFIALNSSISAYPEVERTWVCILLPMYTLCVWPWASYVAYSVIQPSLSVPDCNSIYLVGLLGGLNVIVCVTGSIRHGAMCYLMFCCIILCKVLNLLCLSFLIYK